MREPGPQGKGRFLEIPRPLRAARERQREPAGKQESSATQPASASTAAREEQRGSVRNEEDRASGASSPRFPAVRPRQAASSYQPQRKAALTIVETDSRGASTRSPPRPAPSHRFNFQEQHTKAQSNDSVARISTESSAVCFKTFTYLS